jgi:protein TorT
MKHLTLLMVLTLLNPLNTTSALADDDMGNSVGPNKAITLLNWSTPFSPDSTTTVSNFQWQPDSDNSQRVCAIIPAADTSYWFAINYGLVKKARTLGISLKVFNINPSDSPSEVSKLEQRCITSSPQTIILGTPLSKSFYQMLDQQKKPIQLIAIGKSLQKKQIQASSSPSYTDVGTQLSSYMNNQHPHKTQQSVLFPGEKSVLYVGLFVNSFLATIDQTRYQVKNIIYTSSSYHEIKSRLTQYLNSHLNTTTIIASGLVAQAAVEVLDEMTLTSEVQIISYELSAQVYRDIKRGNIKASISNLPVIQGFLAIDLALKQAANPQQKQHVSPKSLLVNKDNIHSFDISGVFAPYGYRETLEVN